MIDDFRGLYDRGSKETVPIDYASDCVNNIYLNKEVATRPGFDQGINFTNITPTTGVYVRFWLYQITGAAARYLILFYDSGTNTGKIYDTGSATPGTAILSVVGMKDFTVLNMFDRAYITPHNRVTGISAEVLYVYNGTGTARAAAGLKPTTGLTVANGAAGNISAGVHLFAFAFETDSGFITKPSVATAYTAPGGLKANLASIDVGPTGTAKRHTLATRVIVGYDGNPDNYEFFFIPGGEIANNTATTLTVDFIDSALVSTADYLLDMLETIPAGVCLCTYQGSLVSAGEAVNAALKGSAPYLARVSRQGDPEAISAIDGFIKFAPGDGGGVKAVNEFRGLLYAFKDHRTLSSHSNGDAPSVWPVVMIDSGIGTESPFGLAEVLDSRSNNKDGILVSDQAGLYMFTGSYAEKALSYNISDQWTSRIALDNVEISIDPIVFRVYITATLDSEATEPDTILVMDIQDGLGIDKVKWDRWTFRIKIFPEGQPAYEETVKPLSLQTDSDGLIVLFNRTGITYPDDNYLYRLSADLRLDKWHATVSSYGVIDSYYETGDIIGDDEGAVCQWLSARLRILGSGSVGLYYRPMDVVSPFTDILPVIALSNAPGRLYQRLFNAVTETFRFLVEVIPDDGVTNPYYQIRRIIIYGKPLWISRPMTD